MTKIEGMITSDVDHSSKIVKPKFRMLICDFSPKYLVPILKDQDGLLKSLAVAMYGISNFIVKKTGVKMRVKRIEVVDIDEDHSDIKITLK
jgi:hypothetical protein